MNNPGESSPGTSTKAITTAVTYRRGTPADSYTVFTIFEEAIAGLIKSMGINNPTSASDPQAMARMWDERRSLYTHLARSAAEFWLAEQGGQSLGFARSINRDGLHILTELFVLPSAQSAGLGKSLIARALPPNLRGHRIIISSPDNRAQALYMKAGLIPRFPIYYFGRKPQILEVETDLTAVPTGVTDEDLQLLGSLDQSLLGHRRDIDHRWLLSDRQGFLYYRRGRPVGYGYIGRRSGPFALLNPQDFPAVLALAESTAASIGAGRFGLEVPEVNRVAIEYLSGAGFKRDDFVATFMSDDLIGDFERYIITSPPFIL